MKLSETALPIDANSQPVHVFAIKGDPIMLVSADGGATDEVELPEGLYAVSGAAAAWLLMGPTGMDAPTTSNFHLYSYLGVQVLRSEAPWNYIRAIGNGGFSIAIAPIG
jgi:hypothetical protein